MLAVRWGAIDAVDVRKVHNIPTPRMGGLAIYVASTIVSLVFLPWGHHSLALMVGGAMIFLLGVWDDIKGLHPKVKLTGQIITALVVYAMGIRVEFLSNPLDGMISLGILTLPVTVLWIVGVTNALNLIDGLDGLAAGIATIAALTLAVVSWMQGQNQAAMYALILAASAAAFLRFNFFPAKLFMGDSGSMFLGFNLATLAILGTAKMTTAVSLLAPLLALGLPLMDTSWAIMRRIHQRQPVFSADKQHLHHQLLGLGLTHPQAVLMIYGMHTSLSIFAILMARLNAEQSVLMLAALALITVVMVNLLGLIRRQMVTHSRQESPSKRSQWGHRSSHQYQNIRVE